MFHENHKQRSEDHRVLPDADRNYRYHFAAEYRDRGYSVIPVRGKRPAIAWAEYRTRRPTLAEIGAWFGKTAQEEFNVGIVTGRISGLIVVDADSASDASYWKANFPRTPLVVVSGGDQRGEHFYYQMPSDAVVRNRIRVGGRKIDVRGEGGLIVAPPSQHALTGNLYQWDGPLDAYSLDDVPVFDPQWIKAPRNTSPALATESLPSGTAITNIRAYIRAIKSVSGAGGHNSCFRVACLLRDTGLTPAQVLAELILWNESNAEPPWDEKALHHKVRSAFSRRLQE